jgi:hypothetical protein
MDQCYGFENLHLEDTESIFRVEIPRDLSYENVVDLLKILFTLEVGFLQGYSLMETTHICVTLWCQSWKYLDQDNLLITKIVLAYSRSLVKSLQHIFNLVISGDVYEGNCSLSK